MKITEIYKSLQGESSFCGWPCIFIRTSGCNLRCSYCDTKYAYQGGKTLSVQAILNKIKKYNLKLVEITGGEPLLQKDLDFLSRTLLKNGYSVLLETNGSMDISSVPSSVIKILDIKCPGSKMVENNRWKNIDYLTKKDEIKFVITDKRDYNWAKKKIRELSLNKKMKITFSPAQKYISPKKLADWIVADGLDVRFQIQLHKILWPGKRRA